MRKNCRCCPRLCGDASRCGVPYGIEIARTGLHFGEEPCISGTRGSGTIFFAGCNLGCVFCQNNAISRPRKPYRLFSPRELADTFRRLEDLGAENINLVTPSHYASAILAALRLYRPHVPVVCNTSSYEFPDTIRRLAEYVSVWLPDLKFFDPALSKRLCDAEDYFAVASEAIRTMREASPIDEFDENGLLRRGVLVRHLILPSHASDSERLLDFVASLRPVPRISLMAQYVPMGDAASHPDIARRLTTFEYRKVLSYAERLGLDGYSQERASATEAYVPVWGEYA